jgi:hypothetical protein
MGLAGDCGSVVAVGLRVVPDVEWPPRARNVPVFRDRRVPRETPPLVAPPRAADDPPREVLLAPALPPDEPPPPPPPAAKHGTVAKPTAAETIPIYLIRLIIMTSIPLRSERRLTPMVPRKNQANSGAYALFHNAASRRIFIPGMRRRRNLFPAGTFGKTGYVCTVLYRMRPCALPPRSSKSRPELIGLKLHNDVSGRKGWK